MEDNLETRWTHEDTINAYNPYREMFREASAQVVRDIFKEYVNPSDRILEIGSGLGELVNLVPEYKRQIQQTEQSPKIAEGNRRLNSASNVIVANVYALPFKDGKFDVVTGYSVFDTLANLEDALRECSRVLNPDGRFIHFLDLQACANTIFFRYKDSGYIGFPAIDDVGYSIGLRPVPKNEVRKLIDMVDPRKRQLYIFYINQPEVVYELLVNNPQNRDILIDMAQEVQRYFPDAQVVEFNDFFFKNLESALRRTGYEIVESGTRNGVAIIQRKGRYTERQDINLYHNDVGFDRSRYDPTVAQELEPGQVKVISTLYITIAKKAIPQIIRL
jgi:ubiquinone/menaquinone biosynthesis C-methylase UbiE